MLGTRGAAVRWLDGQWRSVEPEPPEAFACDEKRDERRSKGARGKRRREDERTRGHKREDERTTREDDKRGLEERSGREGFSAHLAVVVLDDDGRL